MTFFGFSLISKEQKLLWLSVIQDYKDEVKRLRQELEKERERTNAAVNALLAKSSGLMLTPETRPPDEDQIRKLAFDVFGESDQEEKLREEAEKLDRIQGKRS
jgi:hypothetical protein